MVRGRARLVQARGLEQGHTGGLLVGEGRPRGAAFMHIPLELEVWASWAGHGPRGGDRKAGVIFLSLLTWARGPQRQSWPGRGPCSTSYGLPAKRCR